MNNLHISLTEFRNESRVLKQVESISGLDEIEKVFIASLYADDLSFEEIIKENIYLNRFFLKTRGLNRGLLSQTIKYLEFVFRIFYFYKDKNIGLVNVHSLGLLPLGYLLKVTYGAKLIYDTHELETETDGSRSIRKKLCKLVESLFIRMTDHVFVVSENIANWYQENYSLVRPTVVLNAPVLQNVMDSNYFREKFNIRSDQFIVIYQGGLEVGRGIDLLLSSFKARPKDDVVLILMGYGSLKEGVCKLSKSYSFIFFHEAVPASEVLRFTASADAGIHVIKNSCLNHYYCMPNKLFEYAMAGLPVIVSNMKEMQEFVEFNEMGVIVEENNINAVNNAIDKLRGMDLEKLKNSARKAAVANSWKYQEEKLLAAYKNIVR